MIETNNTHAQLKLQHLPAVLIQPIQQSAYYHNNNVIIIMFMDMGMKRNYIIVSKW